MSCPVLLEPACLAGKVIGSAAGAAAGTAASDALSGIASAIQSGVAWITANSVSWWVKVPSPDLAAEPAVDRLQQWMLPIAGDRRRLRRDRRRREDGTDPQGEPADRRRVRAGRPSPPPPPSACCCPRCC